MNNQNGTSAREALVKACICEATAKFAQESIARGITPTTRELNEVAAEARAEAEAMNKQHILSCPRVKDTVQYKKNLLVEKLRRQDTNRFAITDIVAAKHQEFEAKYLNSCLKAEQCALLDF